MHVDPSTPGGVVDALWHASPLLAPVGTFLSLVAARLFDARKGR